MPLLLGWGIAFIAVAAFCLWVGLSDWWSDRYGNFFGAAEMALDQWVWLTLLVFLVALTTLHIAYYFSRYQLDDFDFKRSLIWTMTMATLIVMYTFATAMVARDEGRVAKAFLDDQIFDQALKACNATTSVEGKPFDWNSSEKRRVFGLRAKASSYTDSFIVTYVLATSRSVCTYEPSIQSASVEYPGR